MTTAAPAWRMKFYPLWPELREMIAEKYAEAGVGKDIFYYVICMFPGKENLAMRKASERRSNYNGDIKTYGRGPGGCVPESKWKELADEGVAPQCSRSPSEWTLFYLHGSPCGWEGGIENGDGRAQELVHALATSLDIALSSFSLALVTRTFYSMWRVVLPVVGETEFELLGFILVMLASFMAGLRWVLLQVLLQFPLPPTNRKSALPLPQQA
ncbi:unnamed protein product [Closterium sp. NIES-64]|nr:unnamed protein product [Closterium sp. NIES-64]